MPAISAPEPRPRRMKRRICCTGQDGGCSQPDSLDHCGLPLVTPPVYSKNWIWSLHTPGALAYLPQSSAGAPSACGPLNAFAAVKIADGDRLAKPTWFMILIVVSVWPKAHRFQI